MPGGTDHDYDKLILEVWTDGSLNPEEAVAHAAKILKDQLSIFITFEEEEEEVSYPKTRRKRRPLMKTFSEAWMN